MGRDPWDPMRISAQLMRVRKADRVVEERLLELQGLHYEVAECLELAERHRRDRYDVHRREWKDQELLKPGKLVWLEVKKGALPILDILPSRKQRPVYVGPLRIIRRVRATTSHALRAAAGLLLRKISEKSRCFKLRRFRLYRRRFSQLNTHFAAFFEIYKMS